MVYTKVTLKMVKEQALLVIFGKTEIDIKECFKMIKRMDMENFTMLKESQSIRVLGKMIK